MNATVAVSARCWSLDLVPPLAAGAGGKRRCAPPEHAGQVRAVPGRVRAEVCGHQPGAERSGADSSHATGGCFSVSWRGQGCLCVCACPAPAMLAAPSGLDRPETGRWGRPRGLEGPWRSCALREVAVEVCTEQTWAPAPVPELHHCPPRCREESRSPVTTCLQAAHPGPFTAASVPPCRAPQ